MSWAATTGGHSGDVVCDVMLAAVENRFGNVLTAPTEIEWLTDNGSGYMAESFVKTMKRDYVAYMPKPDAATAARHLAVAFEHYNEQHPHSALKYRAPREFRRRTDSSTQV
jgi:putative transposase